MSAFELKHQFLSVIKTMINHNKFSKMNLVNHDIVIRAYPQRNSLLARTRPAGTSQCCKHPILRGNSLGRGIWRDNAPRELANDYIL